MQIELTDKNSLLRYFEECLNTREKKSTLPFIILIGGLSRSGKTTLAEWLRLKLVNKKLLTYIIAIDNWIIPVSDRKPNCTVLERFDNPNVFAQIEHLIRGNKLLLHPYLGDIRRRSHSPIELELPPNCSVVIVEGVVALANRNLNTLAQKRIHVTVNNLTRLKRLIRFYRDFKRMDKAEVHSLIRARELEEVTSVRQWSLHAQCVFRYRL